MYVSLETAKNHLEVDHDEDDTLILLYVDAAEGRVENFIGRELRCFVEPCSGSEVESGGDLPAPLQAAILLYVGDLYENREAQAAGVSIVKNPAAESLAWPYRRGLGI